MFIYDHFSKCLSILLIINRFCFQATRDALSVFVEAQSVEVQTIREEANETDGEITDTMKEMVSKGYCICCFPIFP